MEQVRLVCKKINENSAIKILKRRQGFDFKDDIQEVQDQRGEKKNFLIQLFYTPQRQKVCYKSAAKNL